MLFKHQDLNRVAEGRIDLAFRRWRRPTVKSGGTLRTRLGILEIVDVTAVHQDTVTEADASRAGYASRRMLFQALGDDREDVVLYRIELGTLGPDPREALNQISALTSEEVLGLQRLLDRYDTGRAGCWTRQVLRLIAEQPGVRAGDLASIIGVEKQRLKMNVRKLKALGLTESLPVGYRLAPRGQAFLHLDTPDRST